MRFVVDLRRADGRVSGEVSAAGAPPSSFSGWLELLRLLEDGVEQQLGADDLPDGT